MSDIEQKIRERAYQSPSRARAAVSRSSLSKREQLRLVELIDAWEGEGPIDHVVAGTPEAIEAELVDAAVGPSNGGRSVRFLPEPIVVAGTPIVRMNLNAAVRVKLTVQGIAWLHEARSHVKVPDDLLARQGVWETTLWELMAAFGPQCSAGAEPIEGSLIEVLDRRTA